MANRTPTSRVVDALDSVGYGSLAELPGWSAATSETVYELLGSFGEFVDEQIGPLNVVGDREGSRLVAGSGRVQSPSGFAEAYGQYVAAGWQTVPFAEEYGGGGFPWSVTVAMQDILASANTAFSLCPMLTQGSIELLTQWGSPAQRARYLPRLITGEWTGTMNLTEPDAGSDVGAVRTMARPTSTGGWRVSGTKIFITWGDHDLAENIVHLVLARTPDAPKGSRGVSLFLVPGQLGGDGDTFAGPNRVRCVAIERKMGIHASPTCTMEFDEAQGELVGELHGGMRAMFTMMNTARLSVGVEGTALAERAYQAALEYSEVRRQGRLPGDPLERTVVIGTHPDVRRMLSTMRASVDAARLLVYTTAHTLDVARRHPDPQERTKAEEAAGLLIPLAKAWPTDLANEVTSLAIQVHGGAGYVEETGVAQDYRDARIAAIYEGTNGVQAIDLMQRKLSTHPGSAADRLHKEVVQRAECMRGAGLHEEADALAHAADTWWRAVELIVERRASAPLDALAGATPMLTMTSALVGGWLLAGNLVMERGETREGPEGQETTERKQSVARFFLTQLLPQADSLSHAVRGRFTDLVV